MQVEFVSLAIWYVQHAVEVQVQAVQAVHQPEHMTVRQAHAIALMGINKHHL